MPRFGETWFGGYYFGDDDPPPGYYGKSIGRIPLGLTVRKQFSKKVIFKVVRGNGFYGSIKGKPYQTIKKYFVPTSINNVEGEPYRRQFIAAVHKWKYNLTTEQKAEYNLRATKGLHMSGYNLFIREAMKGEVEMYVDRGDPAVYDYAKEDLTTDGAWHDLDLSAIVPAGAKSVLLVGHVEGNGVDWTIMFRKKGNTNEVNHGGMETLRPNVERCRVMVCSVDVNRVLQYNADNQAWANLDLSVRGWWT